MSGYSKNKFICQAIWLMGTWFEPSFNKALCPLLSTGLNQEHLDYSIKVVDWNVEHQREQSKPIRKSLYEGSPSKS